MYKLAFVCAEATGRNYLFPILLSLRLWAICESMLLLYSWLEHCCQRFVPTHNTQQQHITTPFHPLQHNSQKRKGARREKKNFLLGIYFQFYFIYIFPLLVCSLPAASPLRFTHRKSLNRIFHAVRTRQRRCRFPKLFEPLWLWHFHHSFVCFEKKKLFKCIDLCVQASLCFPWNHKSYR